MTYSTRDFSEKRDFIRMQVNTLATITHQGTASAAKCLDLSNKGVLLESKQDFEVNSLMTIDIQSGGGNTPALTANARVLRIMRAENGYFRIAASIEEFQ